MPSRCWIALAVHTQHTTNTDIFDHTHSLNEKEKKWIGEPTRGSCIKLRGGVTETTAIRHFSNNIFMLCAFTVNLQQTKSTINGKHLITLLYICGLFLILCWMLLFLQVERLVAWNRPRIYTFTTSYLNDKHNLRLTVAQHRVHLVSDRARITEGTHASGRQVCRSIISNQINVNQNRIM